MRLDSNTARMIDITISLAGIVFLAPLLLLVTIMVYVDCSSPIFKQKRVGRDKKLFDLYKFRTMKIDTPTIPSHLVNSRQVTRLGRFLRRFKLDELPQLWNVLKGDMGMVGPRPCIPLEKGLIDARDRNNLYLIRPGITGEAQLIGLGTSTPSELVEVESKMVKEMTLSKYLKIIFFTSLGKGFGDVVDYIK